MKISKNKSNIPVHSLQADNSFGLQITRLSNIDASRLQQKTAHRDSHYTFFFQEKGECKMMVDFETKTLATGDIVCILPGQVHHAVSAKKSYTWVLSLDASLLNEVFKQNFEMLLLGSKTICLELDRQKLLHQSLYLLEELYTKSENIHYSGLMMRGAIDCCIGNFASAYYEGEEKQGLMNGRPYIIMRQFRSLLAEAYKTDKSPSSYAKKLNITPAYLSEVVKQVTGFSTSYWIHTQVITEAKRILYYTDFTAKEIAYSLGYEDHTYFSRLFTKLVGMPPIQFRLAYRK